MELLNEILSEGWIIYLLALFLAISITWAIWLHMAFKYRPDEPCGNDVDNFPSETDTNKTKITGKL